VQDIINSKCSMCCPLVLTKACLLYWSIALLTMVCSKSAQTSTRRCFCHVTRHVLASYMLLHAAQVLYSTVLRCGLIGGHKSSEMKSFVSWRRNSAVERARWTGTTPAHWPAGNLFKHNLREMLFELRLCTSNTV